MITDKAFIITPKLKERETNKIIKQTIVSKQKQTGKHKNQ